MLLLVNEKSDLVGKRKVRLVGKILLNHFTFNLTFRLPKNENFK